MTGRNEWYELWLVAAAVLLLAGCGGSPDRAVKDAMQVRCLSEDAQPDLVAAAVALELTAPGPAGRVRVNGEDLTPGQWRSARPGDFRRACAAMINAADVELGASTLGRLLERWSPLLAGVGAALAGGMVTSWHHNSKRRQQLADALGRAAAGLKRAGESYVAGIRDQNEIPHDEVLHHLAAMDAAAAEILVARPSWRVLGEVPETGAPPLNHRLDGWCYDQRHRDRSEVADEVERAIAVRVGTANWQAARAARPHGWWRLRRGSLPDGATALGLSGVTRSI